MSFASPVHATTASCPADVVDLKSGTTTVRFAVEVADTNEARAKGLMFRSELGRFSGMLFVYETAGPAAFWMKNTLIPLDILFADATGTVLSIAQNTVPYSTLPIDGGTDVFAVLEVNGGTSAALGISTGAVLRHPAFDPLRAAWPCE